MLKVPQFDVKPQIIILWVYIFELFNDIFTSSSRIKIMLVVWSTKRVKTTFRVNGSLCQFKQRLVTYAYCIFFLSIPVFSHSMVTLFYVTSVVLLFHSFCDNTCNKERESKNFIKKIRVCDRTTINSSQWRDIYLFDYRTLFSVNLFWLYHINT